MLKSVTTQLGALRFKKSDLNGTFVRQSNCGEGQAMVD